MMPTDLLVISCGGLEENQLWELNDAIRVGVPRIRLVNPGGRSEYHADLYQFLFNERHSAAAAHYVLIGHSLGVDAVVDALWDMDPEWSEPQGVKAIYLLAAVWRTKRLPVWATAPREIALVYDLQPDAPIDVPFLKAGVEGVPETVVHGASHNSICHNPNVILQIVSRLRFIAEN